MFVLILLIIYQLNYLSLHLFAEYLPLADAFIESVPCGIEITAESVNSCTSLPNNFDLINLFFVNSDYYFFPISTKGFPFFTD